MKLLDTWRKLPISIRKPAEKAAVGALLGVAIYLETTKTFDLGALRAAAIGGAVLAAKNALTPREKPDPTP